VTVAAGYLCHVPGRIGLLIVDVRAVAVYLACSRVDRSSERDVREIDISGAVIMTRLNCGIRSCPVTFCTGVTFSCVVFGMVACGRETCGLGGMAVSA